MSLSINKVKNCNVYVKQYFKIFWNLISQTEIWWPIFLNEGVIQRDTWSANENECKDLQNDPFLSKMLFSTTEI